MAADQNQRGPGFGVATAYGVGAVSAGVLTQALTGLALLFYNQVVGLNPAVVGLALMISLVFDAFWDPAIGLWSDHIRSRMGRRHPFMYAAILPAGLFFWLLWTPPAGLSDAGTFAWLVVMLLAARFFSSLYEVPSTALAPEMAPDYHARTGLLGLRYFWGVVGAVGVSVLAFQVFLSERSGGLTRREGYAEFGLAGAAIIGLTLLISCIGTHRAAAAFAPPPARSMRRSALVAEVKVAFSNPNFLAIMFFSLFFAIAAGLTASLTTYFNLYLWGLSTDALSLLALPGLIASVTAVVLSPIVARRWGKMPSAVVLFALSIVTSVLPMGLRLLGLLPGNDWPWLLPLLFAETTLAATFTLMVMILSTSMLADVVEDNAVKTGHRSEGLFFSVNGLLAKSVAGLGTLGAGLMLTAVDFPRHAAPGMVSQEIVHRLAFLYMPVALVLAVLSLLCLSRFRIDQTAHQHNLDRLRSMAAADEAAGAPHVDAV
ncbi:MAG: hypothetical protein EON95_11580 [Caulobacteraceae bacterium]|nr:MAG: hypothetical protein EON95_11580 [Caulobacteraceae bacterium]